MDPDQLAVVSKVFFSRRKNWPIDILIVLLNIYKRSKSKHTNMLKLVKRVRHTLFRDVEMRRKAEN